MIQTRYLTLTDQIEQDIRSGQWHKKLPGVVALSRHYAVAPATVVKAVGVLSERGLVTTQGTRGTFISAAGGKRPVFSTLGVIGMGLDRFRSGPLAQDLLAYEALAARRGFSLLGLQLPVGGRPVEHLHRLPVDGLIFAHSTLTPELVVALRQEGMPFVSLNRIDRIPGVHWVDFDNEQGLRLCLEHLLGLGHRRIGGIAFHYPLQEHQERMLAVYRDVLPAFDSQLILAEAQYRDHWLEHGEQTFRVYGQQMASQLLALPEPPTAMVLHRDEFGFGVMEVVQSMGLRVPEDLSLVAMTTAAHRLGERPFFAHAAVSARSLMLRGLELLMDQTIQARTELVRERMPYNFVPGPSAAPAGQQTLAEMN